MKNILVPIGTSKKSVNTLQYAIDFATISNAKIYVIQVFSSARATGVLKNVDAIIEKEAKEKLEHILSQVDSKNIEIKSAVIKGDVIDLESDLRNQTRYISKCSGAVYTPSNDGFIYKNLTVNSLFFFEYLFSSQLLNLASLVSVSILAR